MTRGLVYGLGVAGAATLRALQRHGVEVVAADDTVTPERAALAARRSVELLDAPDRATLDAVVGGCDLVCPSPGVPEGHPVIDAARRAGVELVTEIELAYRWEQERPGGPRPMLAVTGTDGKTTTTLMTVAMLRAAGRRAIDAGNTETPLVDAVEQDHDVFVVECTSFRLAWTHRFRAEAAAWLNLAPDHLNWHASMASYERAKAQVFANQRPDDVAIGYVDDEVVRRNLRTAPGRHVTFGLHDGDYRLDGDRLVGPAGPITARAAMRRALPHDVTNALAAAALVLEAGLATRSAVAEALATFTGPPHRLELVGTRDGVDWYNDSKATTPHAAQAAIRSFDPVVLIAGGYDKRVDLSPMATDAERLRAVIALGDTAPALGRVFAGAVDVETVADLAAAVDAAARRAHPGDTVLLSPGCASFDQYPGFEARGDHFRELVRRLHAVGPASTPGGTS